MESRRPWWHKTQKALLGKQGFLWEEEKKEELSCVFMNTN